jgi:hypothetical protein
VKSRPLLRHVTSLCLRVHILSRSPSLFPAARRSRRKARRRRQGRCHCARCRQQLMADEERRSRPRGSHSARSLLAFLGPGPGGSSEEMSSTGTTCCTYSFAVEVEDGAPQAQRSSPVICKDYTMAEAAVHLTVVAGGQPVISVSNSLFSFAWETSSIPV